MTKWILLSLGFALLFAITIYYTIEMKKIRKQEQDDLKNANHLKITPMQKFKTEANKMFTEPLDNELTPLQLTEKFITDYETWRAYAWKEKEKNTAEKEWNIGKSYDNLILKYCGQDKKYQSLAYGTDTEVWSDFSILDELIKTNNAIIKVKYTHPQFNFIERTYEFHFAKKDNRWLLVEKYFVDDAEEKHPYL